MTKPLIILILFFVVALPSKGQFQVATLQFGEVLPQSGLINPAIIPNKKVIIGLPGLSSVYANVGLPFSFSEGFSQNGNALEFNVNNIENLKGRKRGIESEVDVQLLFVGFKVSSGFLTLSSRLRSENKVFLPTGLLRWAALGPGNERSENTIDLSDIDLFGANYVEHGISYAARLSGNINFGIRVKYLSGIVGMKGDQKGYIHLSQDSAAISLQDLEYTIGGIEYIESDGLFSGSSFPFGELILGGNPGFGMDMGINMKLTSSLRVSASLTDLGFIKWKTGVDQYKSENVSYSIYGYNINDLLFDNSQSLENELDSVAQLLEPKRTSEASFRSGLNAKLNISANYELTDHSSLGFIMHSAYNKGNIDPIIGVDHILSVGNWFRLLTGVAYADRTVSNITLGVIIQPGPVQYYFITDRLNSFLYPSRTDNLNFRIGMNIAFGKPSVLSN